MNSGAKSVVIGTFMVITIKFKSYPGLIKSKVTKRMFTIVSVFVRTMKVNHSKLSAKLNAS